MKFSDRKGLQLAFLWLWGFLQLGRRRKQTVYFQSWRRRTTYQVSIAKSAAVDKKNIRKAVFSEAKVKNTYLIFNLKIEAVSLVYLARLTFLTRLTFRTTWTCDFTFESSGNSGVSHNRNDELKHYYTISTCTSSSKSIYRTSAEKVTSKRRMSVIQTLT